MAMALPAYLPSPPINSFHIGPLDVHFYALAYLVGITAAVIVTRYRWRAVGGDPELVGELLEMETVDGSTVYRLAGRPDRSATAPPAPAPTTVAPRAVAATDTK